MDNKNTIIALVLMLTVWVGFTMFFSPAGPPPTPAPPPAAPAPVSAPKEAVVSPAPPDVSPSGVPVGVPPIRDVVIENNFFRAVLTTSGARLKSLQLKNYHQPSGLDSPVSLALAGPMQAATLRTTGTDSLTIPADLPFALEGIGEIQEAASLASGQMRTLKFTGRLPDGLVVEKLYTFSGDLYTFDLEVRVTNQGNAPRSGSLALSLVEPWDDSRKGNRLEFVGPSTYVANDLEHDDVGDLAKEPRDYSSGVVWTGFGNRYFLSAAVPLDGSAEKLRIEKSGATVVSRLQSPVRTLAPGEAVSLHYLLYFGPKDLDILKAADHQLAEAVDFGFFSPIARPLLHVLKFFYGFLRNYGLAIILLTVIIKILFWPLTQKSYSSMKDMQKLQPEMQKIREKFKSDREKQNREIMELYRKHRVNPLGGCLPMLVQIPVFFALYKVLLEAIELRQAPFYFWIHDLSAKDPYYITPLIMGGTMFIQQKMTPTTMDPTQAKLFMLMPVIFTFMFLNFPSGLVIYWLVNNLLTIGQQAYINRKSKTGAGK